MATIDLDDASRCCCLHLLLAVRLIGTALFRTKSSISYEEILRNDAAYVRSVLELSKINSRTVASREWNGAGFCGGAVTSEILINVVQMCKNRLRTSRQD